VVIPIRQQFNLPVKYVGLGEKLEDWPCSTSIGLWTPCFDEDHGGGLTRIAHRCDRNPTA